MNPEKDKVNSTDKPRSTVTHVITASGFPDKIWQEWDKSCKEDYGDCRWMKMWMDHLAAKQNNLLAGLLAEIGSMKARIAALETKPSEPEEKKNETLGMNKEVE